MRRWAAGLVACLAISAQTPREFFASNCAGCHGPGGEGSRGPSLRVSTLRHANDVDSMVALLRRGIPGTEMPPTAAEIIADEPLRALATYVLGLRATNRDTVSRGPGRGAELFHGKGKCADCHRVNGVGSVSGPDLTDIGRMRESDWIKRAILEPQAAIYDSFAGYRWTISIPDNYLLVEVTTKKGERVTGSRLNEDAFSIQVRDSEGRIRSFLKGELADVRRQWGKSPMPSYRGVLSDAEVDTLVAYLASLRGLR